MQLNVNNTMVTATYLPFEKPNMGAILQLLLHPSGERDTLHRTLSEDLTAAYPTGVMNKAQVVAGCTEIRLLNATMLMAIDLMRMLGYGVSEIHPYEGR